MNYVDLLRIYEHTTEEEMIINNKKIFFFSAGRISDESAR